MRESAHYATQEKYKVVQARHKGKGKRPIAQVASQEGG